MNTDVNTVVKKYPIVKQVKSWIVEITKPMHGYFENQVTGVEGTLDFRGNLVVDYDGVYELPKSVEQALKELGYEFDDCILSE